jgi:hypothetical protein
MYMQRTWTTESIVRLSNIAIITTVVIFTQNLRSGVVAHACNPSYSGGRDQEDGSFKASQGKIVHETLSRKNPSQKKGWWSGSR